MLYRLHYLSSASPDLIKADIEELVRTSSVKNALLNITGALGYDGERFAQILEGAREDVLALMDTIRADDRHTGVIILDEKPVQRRLYTGWGLKHIDSLIFEDFENAMAEA